MGHFEGSIALFMLCANLLMVSIKTLFVKVVGTCKLKIRVQLVFNDVSNKFYVAP
jgi:hypothetical protein